MAWSPTAGNGLDIGRGITHKRVIVELYAKGYNPLEIARMSIWRSLEHRTYYPESMHLNRMEGNIEGNGN